MNLLFIIVSVVVVWLAIYLVNALLTSFLAKRRAQVVGTEDFASQFAEQKGQMIDVRESDSYKRSHIMGARNIPVLNFSQGKSGLRTERPVFIYGDGVRGASRVAGILKKQGFKRNQLYILKGGFAQFSGRKTK
ncbi:rhodanese-like domain-containing protein [Lactobacillaceae bacterium L1_55_11]|nr:rhodanese-like domain-containing protein [Lactobacillaceae bacterium L1_55_11]